MQSRLIGAPPAGAPLLHLLLLPIRGRPMSYLLLDAIVVQGKAIFLLLHVRACVCCGVKGFNLYLQQCVFLDYREKRWEREKTREVRAAAIAVVVVAKVVTLLLFNCSHVVHYTAHTLIILSRRIRKWRCVGTLRVRRGKQTVTVFAGAMVGFRPLRPLLHVGRKTRFFLVVLFFWVSPDDKCIA